MEHRFPLQPTFFSRYWSPPNTATHAVQESSEGANRSSILELLVEPNDPWPN